MDNTNDSRQTLTHWIKDYSDLVFSVCVKYLKDYEAALDASQHVWEIIIRNVEQFKGKSQPSTWIYSITYHEVLRLAKKEKLTKYQDLLRIYHDPVQQPKPGEMDDPALYTWLSGKCDNCLTGVIMTLTFKTRIIVIFRYLLDLSFEEIARIVDMNEPAVRQAANRGKKRLADFLENECGIFREATVCRCGLEKYLDQTTFRSDMLATRTIAQKARKLQNEGKSFPPIEYWEKLNSECHKQEPSTL